MKFDEFFCIFWGVAIVVLGVARPFDRMVGSTELVFLWVKHMSFNGSGMNYKSIAFFYMVRLRISNS